LLDACLDTNHNHDLTDEEAEARYRCLREEANAIWAQAGAHVGRYRDARALVGHWHSAGVDVDYAGPAYPDDVIAGDADICFDTRSHAYLVRGIMDLAGIEFDVDGRLRTA
jgi:hypothetical protein